MDSKQFTLANGVKVEQGGANKGIWIQAPNFLVFITQSKLALIAQREYDEIEAYKLAKRD